MRSTYQQSLILLKRLPIETYLIFIPCAVAAGALHLVDVLTHRWDIGVDPRQVLMGPMAGGEVMHYSSLAIFLVGGVLLLLYFFGKSNNPSAPLGIARAVHDKRLFVIARSAAYWFIVSGAMVFGTSAIFNVLFKSFSYAEMGAASDTLMRFDMRLFNTHPAFFLHTLDVPLWVQEFSSYCYTYLPSALALILAWTFFTNERLFRICFLSLTLSFAFSLPTWIAFPAIPPYEAYVLNILRRELPPGVKVEVSALSITPETRAKIESAEAMWIDAIQHRSFTVSEFPSTHIIWSSILLYALFCVRRRIGYMFLPFYIGNFFATMYLMQHYAVDTILGVFVSILAIACAIYLLAIEKSYLDERYALQTIMQVMKIRFPAKAAAVKTKESHW